ncbi:hypothetical protein DH2020_049467 [Rehmannia glutinosa]|uniref:Arogenate dehydratase n=1 Tax=Rehmannia glutinosa TaxID=99300 RepID=A0ABR0U379_REHGL
MLPLSKYCPILSKFPPRKYSNYSSSGTVMVSKNISISDATGTKLRVAYQGVPGAYGEAAAMKAHPKCETVPCQHFEDAFKAAEMGLVNEAIIPIENTIGGSVHTNYDLLFRHRVHIVGEIHLLVNHCLLGLPGVSKHDLKCVFSHPQALAQCEKSLIKLGQVATIPAYNTAAAAQTSIVFTLEGPKKLHKALAVFALRGIDLSKIESRPQEKHPLGHVNGLKNGSNTYFNYLFFIDFEASVVEHRAQSALAQLQDMAISLRILGCYPMDSATEKNFWPCLDLYCVI